MNEPTDPLALRTIDLDGLPVELFRNAVVYLDDALRECQLVLVAQGQGVATDADLGEVAHALVPDIEEIADAFRASEATTNDDGTLRLVGSLLVAQSATVADLQVQLVQLGRLGRRGDLLLESDPLVAALLTWVWEEIADQLHGRPPLPYRPAR